MDLKERKKVLIAEIEKKEIRPETKEKAIKAIESFAEHIFDGSGGSSLSDAFVWSNTPQGHDFWDKIDSAIIKE